MRNPTSSKLIQRQEIRIGEYYRFFFNTVNQRKAGWFSNGNYDWNFEMCFILVIAWSESQKTVTKSLRGKKCVVKKQVLMDLFSRWFRILGCVFVFFLADCNMLLIFTGCMMNGYDNCGPKLSTVTCSCEDVKSNWLRRSSRHHLGAPWRLPRKIKKVGRWQLSWEPGSGFAHSKKHVKTLHRYVP